MRITTSGIAKQNGAYLMALRKPGSSIGESWEFPGGKNRRGETPEETLQRELCEELTVDIEVGDLLFTTTFFNKTTQYCLLAYKITLLSEAFQLKEHAKIAWIPETQLLTLPLAPSDREIAEYLTAKLSFRSG